MKKCILVGSIGNLKAACIAAGTFYALKDSGYDVIGMAGSSGGSIPLPLLARGIPRQELYKLMANLNGPSIIDQDGLQQVVDNIRKTIPFLGRRKGDAPFTGLLRGNGLRRQLTQLYKAGDILTFEKAIIPFLVCATKIATARENIPFIEENASATFFAAIRDNKRVSFSKGDVVAPVRASTAIPLIFRPEKIDGDLYLDGGVVDAIPVMPAILEFGADVDVFIADATSDMIEEPLFANDVDTMIEVAAGTIHTMVRNSTLQSLNRASEMLAENGAKLNYIAPKAKIRMTETEKSPAVIESVYAQVMLHLRGL